MSPTTGASTAQVQEELMLCQTWSKYCGLQKVVFPSGDVWIQPLKGPECFSESGGWILVGGNNVASPSSSSSGTEKSRRPSSEFANADDVAGGQNDPSEGELSSHHFSSTRPSGSVSPWSFFPSYLRSFTFQLQTTNPMPALLVGFEWSDPAPAKRPTSSAILSVINPGIPLQLSV